MFNEFSTNPDPIHMKLVSIGITLELQIIMCRHSISSLHNIKMRVSRLLRSHLQLTSTVCCNSRLVSSLLGYLGEFTFLIWDPTLSLAWYAILKAGNSVCIGLWTVAHVNIFCCYLTCSDTCSQQATQRELWALGSFNRLAYPSLCCKCPQDWELPPSEPSVALVTVMLIS
jgi:hypothetical protein